MVQIVQLGVVIFNTGLNLKVFGYKKTGWRGGGQFYIFMRFFQKYRTFLVRYFPKVPFPPCVA